MKESAQNEGRREESPRPTTVGPMENLGHKKCHTRVQVRGLKQERLWVKSLTVIGIINWLINTFKYAYRHKKVGDNCYKRLLVSLRAPAIVCLQLTVHLFQGTGIPILKIQFLRVGLKFK